MASYFFGQSRPLDELACPAHVYTMGFPCPQTLDWRKYTMATAPSYVEGQAVPRETSLMENMMDFSFSRYVTPQMLKILYSVHLLAGLVAAVWFVFSGFQTSTSNGLVAMILSVPALLLWIAYCRVAMELLAGVFRAIQVITNSQG